jgi:ribosomal protein L6P/L9E
MKLNNLRGLIREELKKKIHEDYQDKFKMIGNLITNIEQRPQKEIYSDIRAITGIAVVSSKEPLEYNEQDTVRFRAVITVKVDGYPWITKGGFDRSKMQEIAAQIRKVPGVVSFNVADDNISAL